MLYDKMYSKHFREGSEGSEQTGQVAVPILTLSTLLCKQWKGSWYMTKCTAGILERSQKGQSRQDRWLYPSPFPTPRQVALPIQHFAVNSETTVSCYIPVYEEMSTTTEQVGHFRERSEGSEKSWTGSWIHPLFLKTSPHKLKKNNFYTTKCK
jgi:hypothetical protein